MSEVSLSVSAKQRVALLARAWGVTEGEVIERVLDEYQRGEPATSPTPPRGLVAVHAVYENARIEGRFDPAAHSLEITNGPLAGRTYRSPSGAAIAVVSLYNRSVSPNRNGWSFWIISDTGERLPVLRAGR